MRRMKVAVIGSGNIGTDLMIKVMRRSQNLEMGAMVGIDPTSDGLARAARLRVPTTAEGVDGLIALAGFDEIGVVFDATSARAHVANAAKLAPFGKWLIDLTPAAIGPFAVPAVNLGQHLDAPNINMVTCGGQATIPMVAAISRVTEWRTPRSSRRSPPSRLGPAPARTSMSSLKRPRTPSRPWAVLAAARRSSFSTPLSRR
jgi:acetaldehyde dehydrogenase